MDVNNFNDFSNEEYLENLNRLGIENYSDLIGGEVNYSKYGKHKVIDWCPDKAEYLLYFEGNRFWTNPFRINKIN